MGYFVYNNYIPMQETHDNNKVPLQPFRFYMYPLIYHDATLDSGAAIISNKLLCSSNNKLLSE